jgi:hypothetical protein
MNDDAEEWNQLKDAIGRGEVSPVQTLLTRHPDLIRYRDILVSPCGADDNTLKTL